MSDHYRNKLRNAKKLELKRTSVDKGFSSVDIPQACFVTATGPTGKNKELRFLETTVFMCTALALVGQKKKGSREYPTVVFAHIDDSGLEDDEWVVTNPTMALIHFSRLQLGLENLRAYVVNGDYEPPLVSSIAETLDGAKIPYELSIGCRNETLVIDLVDGKPVAPSVVHDNAKYVKTPELTEYEHNIVFGFRDPPVHYLFDFETHRITDIWERVGAMPSRKAEELFAEEFKRGATKTQEPAAVAGGEKHNQHTEEAKDKICPKRKGVLDLIPVVSIKDYRLGHFVSTWKGPCPREFKP